MAKAEDIARYILWLAQSESEPMPVTQMQLHKLLYYVQGWCLAMRGTCFFDGDIKGWSYGPVVKEIYRTFNRFKSDGIPIDEAKNESEIGLGVADASFVQSIWDSYKQFSPWALSEMTHKERPWLEARRGLKDNQQGNRSLSLETMQDFFREKYDATARPGLKSEDLDRADRAISSRNGVSLADARKRLANSI